MSMTTEEFKEWEALEKKSAPFLGLLMVALTPLHIFVKGFTVKCLWAWFAVPMFGLPPITIAGGVGISIIAGHLTLQGTDYYDAGEHGAFLVFGRGVAHALVRPMFYLLIGYIVKGFMP